MPRRLALCAAALAAVVAALPAGQARATPAPAGSGPVTVDASFFGGTTPPLTPGQIEVAVVSSLTSTVTGEDARIEVRGLAPADRLRVERDGTDVTPALAPAGAGVVDGVVGGLRVGLNHLTATATGPAGSRQATLEVTDHPITGPVISGPHQSPFVCETEQSGLGKPLDADCSVKPSADWYARSMNGRFNKLDDPYASYPPDTATTTTSQGKTVPFVVRVESSTINRSITRLAAWS